MGRKKSAGGYSHDCAPEQSFIKYISVPSLESVTAVNTVAELWKQPNLKKELQEHAYKFSSALGYSYNDRRASFNLMEEKVLEKLFHLSLSSLLKDKMSNIVRPIGLEILKWIDPYLDHNYIGDMSSICWTMEGTIDKVKTLESHLNDENLDYTYKKACKYCSESHIAELWRQASKDTQDSLLHREYKGYS